MKLFRKSYDGGADSGVTGYWLIESKSLFSIVLLHFSPGSREAFHSHAFNAWTWWIKGTVEEELMGIDGRAKETRSWRPSWRVKKSPKHLFHKIIAGPSGAWALSLRGPWDDYWLEYKNGVAYTMTHGRVRLNDVELTESVVNE